MYSDTDDTIEISIPAADRDLLQDVPDLPQDVLERFSFAVPDGQTITVTLDPNDLDELLFCLGDYADALTDKKLRQRARRLYEHISEQEPEYEDEEGGDELSMSNQDVASLILFANLPDAIRADLDALVNEHGESDMGALLGTVMEKHGTIPQSTLAGLNFLQFMALMIEEWDSPNSPMLLSDALTAADLKDAYLLHNACVLLESIGAGVAVDEDGYFPEEFVEAILPKLRGIRGGAPEAAAEGMDLLEEDVDELIAAHFLVESAGLALTEGDTIRVTESGKAALAPDQIGDLYKAMFIAHYRLLALECLDPFEDWPSLQIGVPFTLYKLAQTNHAWSTAETGDVPFLLPAANVDMPEDEFSGEDDLDYALFLDRILLTLHSLGLVELDFTLPADEDKARFRTTPLFDKFIKFQMP